MANTIRVLAVNDPAVHVYVDPNYQILKGFMEQHQVQVEFDIVDFDQYYPALMEVFTQQRQADIVMVAGHFWLADFVSQGFLKPLNYPLDKFYHRQDILPVIAKEMQVNGVDYLYPSFCDGHVICYRKSLVEKVLNHPLEEVITTTEYLNYLAQMAKDPEFKGIAYRASAPEIFLDALPFMRQHGIEVFDQAGNFHYDVQRMKAALEDYLTLKKYANQDMSVYGNEEVAADIRNNMVSLGVSWGGQLGVILNDECVDPDDIGFSTFKTAWNVTWSFGLVNQTNHPLSENLLQYLSSSEVDRIVGAYAGSPVRKSTYEKDLNRYPWYGMHLKLIEDYAQPLPSIKNAGNLLGIFYQRIYQAYVGEISVEAAANLIEVDVLNRLGG